ncbi:MAG: bifunctional 23S rRNA (guanine(2069)-N(7))-methyltransferase RlmK/23S rRNA (guanine(2445)-N(2))-methyltransferase RlmL, partial [Myxococcales bacterium]|nr:bifunctional 23S rRNA (guanine(2069)-N(7))-methyltransferase RlmK/23S rRNA (guanine(2445)-N(2))-methyltransferase RlmL [Myxococcales bacterium]HJK92667.1 bifunctional 23S rRNA (guanine(2069)-N(7))-methyltransferase RlmK/23S rRNA (guanine(2445)-N(2))-methyltransferase RlmL [Polyangiaceae bacterium LLY-WYZ-15_(1-7)]
QGAAAPLRESLAAAILRLAGWRPGEPLVDPMCGSGTFLAEAAGRVRDVAPGLSRRLGGWKGHEGAAWSALVRDARDRKDAAALRPLQLHGRDADPEAVAMAREALLRAGFPDLPVQVQALEDQAAPEGPPGHVLVNPPYGERLGARGELVFLYARLGDVLKRRFPGWTAHVLAGEPDLLKHVGLRADAKRTLFNGPLEARLATYRIHARAPESAPEEGPGWRKASEESQAFANRVKKNRTRLGRWAKRHGIHVWRVYDADIPEFNVAVDLYEGVGVVVQEYARPKKVDPMVADRRLRDVMLRVPELLDVDEKDVHLRVRAKQGAGQYGKRADEGERHEVIEAGLRFGVNLTDYLDTGLFADQRELRARAAEAAGERGGEEGGGARFLNLFAYTCSASVHAAARGASTTSVDLSRTYLDWGEESFRRNGLDPAAHAFVRADVERFLADVGSARWDVIYLNPPSFSRSKAMEGDFVVARDHGPLIEAAMKALAPGGVLFFSTHARGFRLDDALERRFDVRDIGREVVPRDFQRSPFRAYALRARP